MTVSRQLVGIVLKYLIFNSSFTVLVLTHEVKSFGNIQDGVFTCEDCYLFNLTTAMSNIPEHVKPTVAEIDFSGNNILMIPTNVFLNFSNCVELNMAYSSIRSMRPYAFSGMDSLRKLNLSGNLIDILRERDFVGPRTTERALSSRQPYVICGVSLV